jgi:DNA-binding SARP family transcriptional activator
VGPARPAADWHDPSVTSQKISIGVLGPIEATAGGAPLSLGGPKPRAVLAALAASLGHVVAASQLAKAVWGDEEVGRPDHTLQVYVSTLRKALEPGRRDADNHALATRQPGYVLRAEAVDLDLARFDALRDRGRVELDTDAARAAGTWRDALQQWRGPAFADLRGRAWFDTRGTRLDEQRLATEEDLCDALLSCGRNDEVITRLEALTAEHPFRERPRGQLMLALYRTGRQADALAVFRTTRDTLIEELGIEPGAELRRLEDAVLNQDPALLDANPSDDVGATIDTRRLDRRGSLVLPDGQRFALSIGPTLIGRAPGVSLQLADNRVSRRHALIEFDGTSHVLSDLGSTNGTSVNDEPVLEARALLPGDVISVGGLCLGFES